MKRKLSFVISAVLILLSVTPSVTAQTGPEPHIINLTEKDDATVSAGYESVNSGYTGEITAHGKMSNIIDGSDNTYWYSQHQYDRPYVVLDLGEIYTLTEIRYLPFDGFTDDYTDEDGNLKKPGDYWRDQFEIQLSNQADFSKFKTVYAQGDDGIEDNASVTVTLDRNINQYRYIRIYRTVGEDDPVYPIGIRELTVTGYDTFYPQDMIRTTDGNVRDGVTAVSPNGYYTGSTAYKEPANVTDNSTATTFISAFGEQNPYVQIDLGVVRAIDKIRVMPFKGANADAQSSWYFRSGLRITASNYEDFRDGGTLLCDMGEYTQENALSPDEWLEADTEILYSLYRYIRITASADVIGISEVQVEGYDIFETGMAQSDNPCVYFTKDNTKITAHSASGGNNTVIIAAYRTDKTLAELETGEESASLTLNDAYTYKAFLWDSLSGMKAAAYAATFE